MGRRSEDLADRLLPENLQDLQDTLARALGLPLLVVGPLGRPLTVCEDLTQFCRYFTRAVPIQRPCLECGRSGRADHSEKSELTAVRSGASLHSCPLGLTDLALPIFCAGEVLAYLLTAQIRVKHEGGREASPEAVREPGQDDEHRALLARAPAVSIAELERIGAALTVAGSLLGGLASARRRNLRLAERVRRQSRRIRELTVTDAVTGVANRRRFLETLVAEVRRARRYKRDLSVVAARIESFDYLNREFGHDVGDSVLVSVAQCLTGTLRQTDLVGRVSGDEFGLLLPETSRHQALVAVSRVANAVEDLNASGELPVEIRLATGIVDSLADADDMLEAARQTAQRVFGAVALVGDSGG